MRALTSGCLVWLLFLSACASSDPGNSVTAANAGAPAGGAANTGTSVGGAADAGTSAGGAANTGGSPGAAGPVAGSGGNGGGDNGDLFEPGSDVPFNPDAGSSAGSGGAPATAPPGDGNMVTAHIGGSASGTALFTQKGTDVTVVVKLTQCPTGTLGIFITNGLSCDNTTTEGTVWDGKRGYIGDTGAITCNNNSASLTYTRSGSDPTLNWTVADHNTKTDLSQYVVIVTSSASPTSSYIACGNFFS